MYPARWSHALAAQGHTPSDALHFQTAGKIHSAQSSQLKSKRGECTRVIMNTGNIMGDRLGRTGIAHERRSWVCLRYVPGLGTGTANEARAITAGRVTAGRAAALANARGGVYQLEYWRIIAHTYVHDDM